MQENKHPVGGVLYILVPYQTDVKLGCALSCMAAHIHLTVAKFHFKNCKKGLSVHSNVDGPGHAFWACMSNNISNNGNNFPSLLKFSKTVLRIETILTGKTAKETLYVRHLQLPRTECLQSLFCHFLKGTSLLLLSECVQPCIKGSIQLLCQFDSGLVPLQLDVCFLAFYSIFIELFEFELVFRNFFCWVYIWTCHGITQNINNTTN